MYRRQGFTLVELLITITIMVTLLILAVVSLRSSQVAARDKAREAQAHSIAIYFEDLYDNGFTGSSGLTLTKGQYPYAGLIANSCNSDCSSATSDFSTNTTKLEDLFSQEGFDLSTLKAPDQTSYSLVVASNGSLAQQSETGLTSPKPTIDTFVYQPIMYTTSSGSSATLCNLASSDCRAFNLFYKTEADGVVHKITSKHS